jgi:hypothetical protein
MFSIRNKAILFASLLVLAGAGCQWRKPEKPAAVENNPLPPDPAIQLRDWPQQTAWYANGATVAGPTGYPLKPTPNQSDWSYYYADLGVWAANTVMMPFVLVITPPWTEQITRGELVLATYTGQPPLPPQVTPGYVPKGIRPPVTASVTTTSTTTATTASRPLVRPTTTVPAAAHPTTAPPASRTVVPAAISPSTRPASTLNK